MRTAWCGKSPREHEDVQLSDMVTKYLEKLKKLHFTQLLCCMSGLPDSATNELIKEVLGIWNDDGKAALADLELSIKKRLKRSLETVKKGKGLVATPKPTIQHRDLQQGARPIQQ
nr:unnamed protein product [Spirometra erinaceieuropaei]